MAEWRHTFLWPTGRLGVCSQAAFRMHCFDRHTSQLACVFQPLLFLFVGHFSYLEVGKEGWAYPLQNIPLRASLRILLFWCWCFTLLNASILEQMIRKASRERAPFLAESLGIACLNSPFLDVCTGQATLSRCCRGLSAQQHDSQARQIAGRWMVRNLSVSENPSQSFRAAEQDQKCCSFPMGSNSPGADGSFSSPLGREWETGGQEPCWRPLPKVCRGAGFTGL